MSNKLVSILRHAVGSSVVVSVGWCVFRCSVDGLPRKEALRAGMKVLSFDGARLQCIKTAVLSRALRHLHHEVLLHAGQHSDGYLNRNGHALYSKLIENYLLENQLVPCKFLTLEAAAGAGCPG